MAFSQESGAVQGTPIAQMKPYNGGAVTLTPGNNTMRVNIGLSAANAVINGANGIYRISRAVVANGVAGAYAVLGNVVAIPQQASPNAAYDTAIYNDNTAVNGTLYSYTVALDNNA